MQARTKKQVRGKIGAETLFRGVRQLLGGDKTDFTAFCLGFWVNL